MGESKMGKNKFATWVLNRIEVNTEYIVVIFVYSNKFT